MTDRFEGGDKARWLSRGLVVWLLLMGVETLNGTLREIFIVPILGGRHARQVSMPIALLVIFSITLASIRWIGTIDKRQLFLLGVIWSVMTVCFEYLIAVVALGQSWETFAQDYYISSGGLMPFGLVLLLFSPLLASRITRFRR